MSGELSPGFNEAQSPERENPRTQLESRHVQDGREHALVVAMQHTTNASKGSDVEDSEVLEQGSRLTGAHESLAPAQGGIIDPRADIAAAAHLCKTTAVWS